MPTWAGLFQQIDRMDPLDRRLTAEREDFERWAASAERRVMDEIARVASRRSRELHTRTGLSLGVASHLDEREIGSFGGAHRLVSLSLAGSAVDLYSVRSEGESPSIYLAHERAPTSSRFPVIVTLPGVLIVRSGVSEWRVLGLPERDAMTVDGLVLRAFAMLCGAFVSVADERAGALAAPS